MILDNYSFSIKYSLKNLLKKSFLYTLFMSLKKKEFAKEIKSEQDEFFEINPLFTHVEIETINRCNNDCPFCPVNKKADIREYKKMDEELFKKIINELAELKYDKDISYYSNNEPLLDNRIFGFIKYSKEKLPNAKHILYTNGILINRDKYEKLFDAGLDFLLIDNYDDDGKLIKPVQELYDYYKDNRDKNSSKTKIVFRRKTEVLSNRSGVAPNAKELQKPLELSCYLPFKQLIIRPDGKVSICCYDSYGKSSMGDLTKMSIKELWYGKKHMNLLKHLYQKGRVGIPICETCDTSATKNSVWGGIS